MKPFHSTAESSQVSEEQLNDAIAQAVENSKARKDKSQWGADGEALVTSFPLVL